jgi:hypothetical protein
MNMQLSTKIIRNFLLLCLLSTQAFCQDVGTVGIKAGISMPNNLVGNLVNPGKGLVLQFNSKYFYQVRGRFSIEYYKYAPSDSIFNTFSETFAYDPFSNVYHYVIVPATLSFSKFNSIDVSMGLDYNPFKKIPELYFGPQVFAGLDQTTYTSKVYDSSFDPIITSDTRSFIHGGVRLHIGIEKALGKIALFTEYSIAKNYSENYNAAYSSNTLNIISATYHQFGLGIRF